MKNKVFIGAGFIDSQLLWVIPLVHGFCKKKGIPNPPANLKAKK